MKLNKQPRTKKVDTKSAKEINLALQARIEELENELSSIKRNGSSSAPDDVSDIVNSLRDDYEHKLLKAQEGFDLKTKENEMRHCEEISRIQMEFETKIKNLKSKTANIPSGEIKNENPQTLKKRLKFCASPTIEGLKFVYETIGDVSTWMHIPNSTLASVMETKYIKDFREEASLLGLMEFKYEQIPGSKRKGFFYKIRCSM